MSRRRLLRALAVGATGSLAGCSFFGGETTPEPTPTPTPSVGRTPARGRRKREVPAELEQQYDTVHNVVQAGADHTGSRPVTDVLRTHLGNQTALYFPRGEYRMDTPLSIHEFSNIALVGDRALIRPPKGYSAELFDFGTEGSASGLRFEGIDFDNTASNTGSRPIHASLTDDLLVRDVTVYGRQDVNQDSMRFDITDRSGSGRVEGVRLPDGGVTRYPITGIYVGEKTVGALDFVDCHVAGFPDNGLYASPARGKISVDGGTYANNGISGVRVSGGDRVTNVHIVCDSTRTGLENMRGIRLREGSNVVVRGCQVDMKQVTESDAGITMAEWLETATIRDTVVRTDADDVTGIRAKRPNRGILRSGRSKQHNVTFENVQIVGKGSSESAISVANRNDCQFDNVCIRQLGPNRDGIVLRNSVGSVLKKTVINVTGEPLVLDNARTRRRQIQVGEFGAVC